MGKDDLAQTLLKGLDVLECVAASKEPISAVSVAERTGISRPTAYRLLISLEEKGYVTRESSSTFKIGSSVMKLCKNELDKHELTEIARPSLKKLCEAIGETSILSILSGTDVINIARVESSRTIKIESKVGSITPAYCTATGKAILAFMEPIKRDEIIARMNFVQRTGHTISSASALQTHLERVKAQGYAVDDHEYDDEMKCISAPVFDMNGKVIAAIGFSGVAFRVEKLDQNEIVRKVVDAASEVSAKLGYKK